MAAYLTQVIEEGDSGEFAHAPDVAARARGMTQIAEAAGIGRESLYKALRADASPRFDTKRLSMQGAEPAYRCSGLS